ncbi:MAG: class C sortase [Ruminococcus sp.]|nr:class C sortase [Ruminococcus sp.]
MKNKIYNILIFTALGICLVFVLMNPVTQLINRMYSNGVVTVYDNQVSSMSNDDKDYLFEEARKYNENLTNNVADCFSSDAFNTNSNYENILNITGNGVMGTVSIPIINCNLPIYHGSSDEVFDKGAVHMASTSFPIGGENTHSVISAHTAYPGKVFFDKLTDVESGDYFYITILDKTLAYKVCQIDVVLPNETNLLKLAKEQDIITLVTCTPYAVNTHRLLVRGQRDLNEEERIKRENIDANQSGDTDKILYYLIIIFIIAILLAGAMIFTRHYRKEGVNAYV